MYLYLAQNLDTLSTPTRPEGYNHNELTMSRKAYLPTPPGTDLTTMSCTLKPVGLNLINITATANFDIGGLQALQYKNLEVGSEQLSPYAIRDCVQVTTDDIKNMADDIALVVVPDMPTLTPAPVINVYDERKFALYKSKNKGRKLRKHIRGRRERRLHLNKKQPAKARSPLQPRDWKPRASGTSITNFLFKLLF